MTTHMHGMPVAATISAITRMPCGTSAGSRISPTRIASSIFPSATGDCFRVCVEKRNSVAFADAKLVRQIFGQVCNPGFAFYIVERPVSKHSRRMPIPIVPAQCCAT